MIKEFNIPDGYNNLLNVKMNLVTKEISIHGGVFFPVSLENQDGVKFLVTSEIVSRGWHTYQNYVKIKIPVNYKLGIDREYMMLSPKRFHVHLVDFLPLHRFHQANCEMEITQEKESWFVEVVW